MNTGLIATILEGLIRSLPTDLVKKGLDGFLDFIENAISKSGNKWDDAVFLPLLTALRAQLGISETSGSAYEDKPPVASVDVNVTVTDKTGTKGTDNVG